MEIPDNQVQIDPSGPNIPIQGQSLPEIPDNQVKVDQEIPDDQVQLDTPTTKYGTPEQEIKAGIEGAAQGVLGPLAPLAEQDRSTRD